MTQTTRQYEQYILECLNFDGYAIPEENQLKTDKQRLQALYDIFKGETQYKDSDNLSVSLRDWLQGLPSSVNIDFSYSDILKRAIEYGSLPVNATEKQEDKLLLNYWNYMAMRLIGLFRKHGVDY